MKKKLCSDHRRNKKYGLAPEPNLFSPKIASVKAEWRVTGHYVTWGYTATTTDGTKHEMSFEEVKAWEARGGVVIHESPVALPESPEFPVSSISDIVFENHAENTKVEWIEHKLPSFP
jgi:hypothetical protein